MRALDLNNNNLRSYTLVVRIDSVKYTQLELLKTLVNSKVEVNLISYEVVTRLKLEN